MSYSDKKPNLRKRSDDKLHRMVIGLLGNCVIKDSRISFRSTPYSNNTHIYDMVVVLNPELVEGESRTAYEVEGRITLYAVN